MPAAGPAPSTQSLKKYQLSALAEKTVSAMCGDLRAARGAGELFAEDLKRDKIYNTYYHNKHILPVQLVEVMPYYPIVKKGAL